MTPRLLATFAFTSAALAAACGDAVDLAPPGDYTTWERFDVRGPAPGHGDTYRIIYANPTVTQSPSLFGGYPDGSILVKEIHEDVDGQPGDLAYVAIMRRLPPPGGEEWALTDRRRWLFSMADAPNGDETSSDACWSRCHVAAPYNGAWYDYRVPVPPPP